MPSVRNVPKRIYQESKEIYLIGNGLDLSYNLPTNYIDFIHTVNYIQKPSIRIKKSWGQVTAGEIFDKICRNHKTGKIPTSYHNYKFIYDKMSLNSEEFDMLVKESKSNIWLNYLTKSLSEDVGWIDFEKEISKVIKAFHILFELNEKGVTTFRIPKKQKDVAYIAKRFNYYYETKKGWLSNLLQKIGCKNYIFKVKNKYLKEEPYSSCNYVIDKEKILKELFESLECFSKMLKLYLKLFVEKPLKEIDANLSLSVNKNAIFVTLNYTKTLEIILGNKNTIFEPPKNVFHLHGSTDGDIVLGIHSDMYDELENMDSAFIFFKKYYQRLIYHTDRKYIDLITKLKRDKKSRKKIIVYGHSLDVTDKDIIKEIFDIANEIVVLYHNTEALSRYITNIVTIFGKQAFDELRAKKKLTFTNQAEYFNDNEKTYN